MPDELRLTDAELVKRLRSQLTRQREVIGYLEGALELFRGDPVADEALGRLAAWRGK